jgi:ribosomal protein S18 acetylase RimI-like enzyme
VSAALSADVRLRPVSADDAGFLLRLYASTREAELALLPWEQGAKEAFVRMQFAAQDRYYRQTFPGARHDIILAGEEPAGRLYVHRGPEAMLVVDLALLPGHRGRGIGTALLRELLSEAAAAGAPVRLHVEHDSPARRLYERLGFRPIVDQGVYLLLEHRSPAPHQPNTASYRIPVPSRPIGTRNRSSSPSSSTTTR